MSEEKYQKCWDGKYPLFVEWDEHMQMEFVEDEEALVAFFSAHQLNPRKLQYYGAKPIYAWEGVSINTEELENDDGELDEEVQALIDELKQKLRAIKRPIIYWNYYCPFKISESKLASWCAKAKGVEMSEESTTVEVIETIREDIKAEGCAPTNGDRVRSMSNEELAEFFKRECPPMEKVNYSCPYSCKNCWIHWLNAIAETKGGVRR